MKLKGKLGEVVYVHEIGWDQRRFLMDNDLKTGLSIVWNVGEATRLRIDHVDVSLDTDEVLFFTELHRVTYCDFDNLRLIRFNKSFFCVENHDSDVGCRGMLFFGAHNIPRIIIDADIRPRFDLVWTLLEYELEERDNLQVEMMQTLLKRFLIMCLRIYVKSHESLALDNEQLDLLREYNFLVEKHYKTKTRVSEYAALLNRSSKTISNLFAKYGQGRTALQVIHERRLLDAKRQLANTGSSVKEIAYDLNFNDIQSFSHFFRKNVGFSPSAYRKSLEHEKF